MEIIKVFIIRFAPKSWLVTTKTWRRYSLIPVVIRENVMRSQGLGCSPIKAVRELGK